MPLRTQKDLPKFLPGCSKKPLRRVNAVKVARLQTKPYEKVVPYKCKLCSYWHTGRYLKPETIRKIEQGVIDPPKKKRRHYKFRHKQPPVDLDKANA